MPDVMSQGCGKNSSVGSVALRCMLGVALTVPLGLLVGTLLGLIRDFGVRHMVANIRLNPGIFADQYGANLVYTGWTALACLSASAVIVGMQSFMRRSRGWPR